MERTPSPVAPLKFALGTPDGIVDLDRLLDTRLLVQANSGAGKSWGLRRILEQTHGAVQQFVIDPEGEFPTLREKFDYVLAAKHGGDTAADPSSAKLLAERLLELGVSAVLDIYELRAHERVKFVRSFLEAMVDAPRKLWHPVLVVLDEAHVYAPERGHGEAESQGAVIDLATRGRKRGFCLVAATQRLSKLHKDVAAELGNKLIGRTALDVDLKRAADELGFSKDGARSLRSMAISREVVTVNIGLVQTRHPQAGARLSSPPPAPSEKVKAVLAKLADLPKEAEKQRQTLEDLHQENARLKRELAQVERTRVVEKVVEKVEVEVVKPETAAKIESSSKFLVSHSESLVEGFQKSMDDSLVQLQSALDEWREIARQIRDIPTVNVAPRQVLDAKAAQVNREFVHSLASRPPQTPTSPMDLTGPEQRILDALAWLEAVGVKSADNAAVAFVAGYSVGGGAYNNPRGALRTKGLIDYNGGGVSLTPEGRAAANPPDMGVTSAELRQRVLQRLPGPESKLLTVIMKVFPKKISNQDLADQTGYAVGGGAFNNPRGRLHTLGLITYPERGYLRASEYLFL
jgi:hypothetical protein